MVDLKGLLNAIVRRTDAGSISVGDVSANSYKDVSVSFHHAFEAVPSVVVCLNSNSTSPKIGLVTAAVQSRTKTGFKVRVFNADTTTRTPWVDWIATLEWGGTA